MNLQGAVCCSLVLVAAVSALGQAGVILAWDPPADGSALGYRVYQGTNSRSYNTVTTVGSLTQASFGGLTSGITYYFAVTAYDANGLESNFSTEVNCVPAAAKPPPLLGVNFAADVGTISSPFVSSNGNIFQAVSTGVGDGGRAVYDFNIQDPGDYVISAVVYGANSAGNSFYVNVDSEPTDPKTIWNIPATSGFETNVVTWPGSGRPQIFTLGAGSHELIIRGRSSFTQLGAISISPYDVTSLSFPWQTQVIGNGLLATDASDSNGVYTVLGTGALTGTSDTFRFVYQTLTGDGEIRARIASIQSQNTTAYSGIMIRESLTPGSRYAALGMNKAGNFRWQRRSKTAGATISALFGKTQFPNAWVRIVRKGGIFTASKSVDGKKWTIIGTLPIPMATNIYVGFAVSSGSMNAVSTASFDNAAVVP